jgi:hypothetical protein
MAKTNLWRCKLLQVKIFSQDTPEGLEKIANKWLQDNKQREITSRHIQQDGTRFILTIFHVRDITRLQPLEQVKIFEAIDHADLEACMNNWLIRNTGLTAIPVFIQHAGASNFVSAIFYTKQTA